MMVDRSVSDFPVAQASVQSSTERSSGSVSESSCSTSEQSSPSHLLLLPPSEPGVRHYSDVAVSSSQESLEKINTEYWRGLPPASFGACKIPHAALGSRVFLPPQADASTSLCDAPLSSPFKSPFSFWCKTHPRSFDRFPTEATLQLQHHEDSTQASNTCVHHGGYCSLSGALMMKLMFIGGGATPAWSLLLDCDADAAAAAPPQDGLESSPPIITTTTTTCALHQCASQDACSQPWTPNDGRGLKAVEVLVHSPLVYPTVLQCAAKGIADATGARAVPFDKILLDRVVRLISTGRSQIRKRIIQLTSILILATEAMAEGGAVVDSTAADETAKRRKKCLETKAFSIHHLATLIDLARSLLSCDLPAETCVSESFSSTAVGGLSVAQWVEEEVLGAVYNSSSSTCRTGSGVGREHPISSFSSSASCSPSRRPRTRSSATASSSDDASPRFNIGFTPNSQTSSSGQRGGRKTHATTSACNVICQAIRIATSQKGVVVLISGAAGSGKSTLACHLANRLGIANVVSTDTVRHVLRCRYAKSEDNPFLFASTYDAGKHLTDEEVDAVIEKHGLLTGEFSAQKEHNAEENKKRGGASPNFPPSPYLKQQWESNSGPRSTGTANLPPVHFRRAFNFQGREEVRCIEGYRRQSELVFDRLFFCVEQIVRSGDSVIVEGVHLFGSNIVRFFRRLAGLCPCIAFLVRIPTERCHLKRFAARSQNFNTQPSCNKYVQHVKNIRLIQDYLVAGANAINTSALERRQCQRAAQHSKFVAAQHGSDYYHVRVIDNIAVASAIQVMHKDFIRLVLERTKDN